uniref:Uncharacterized protein n=1 Tax=Acrobeloides nanus TaxID=290746 RepID=A0A914EHL6_9BILA
MQLLENGQLFDSFIQLFKGGDKGPFDDQMLTPQISQPRSRHPKNSNFRGYHLNAAKTRVVSSNQPLRIQEDQPIGMPPKSQEEYSHDQAPIVVQKSEEDPSLVERAASTSQSSPIHETVEVMEFEAGEIDILQLDEIVEFMEFEYLLVEESEVKN